MCTLFPCNGSSTFCGNQRGLCFCTHECAGDWHCTKVIGLLCGSHCWLRQASGSEVLVQVKVGQEMSRCAHLFPVSWLFKESQGCSPGCYRIIQTISVILLLGRYEWMQIIRNIHFTYPDFTKQRRVVFLRSCLKSCSFSPAIYMYSFI